MPAYTQLDNEYAALKLGSRIREARKLRGWPLSQLATRLSLSVGTLSAIENQKAPIHLDLLFAIANALNVPIDVLLPRSGTAHFHIARRDHTRSEPPLPLKIVNVARGSLLSYHNRLWPLARPFIEKHIEPFEIEVQSGPNKNLHFIAHNTEEFVFVLRGRIQCLLKTPDGLTDVTLTAGDSTYFWSYLPHSIRSLDDEPARTIHVEYSRDKVADAEYGTNALGPTIYLINPGQESLAARIANKIVGLRRACGMSVSQLAEELGISPRRVKQIESASKPISIDILLRVCHVFQKPKEYFLSQADVERPFSFVLRARDVRKAAVASSHRRTRAASSTCCCRAHEIPLAEGFPKHSMQPYIVRLKGPQASPRLHAHAGHEFVYVLRGAVRFSTTHENRIIQEALLPGDACYLESSVPHAFVATEHTVQDVLEAEMLVVRCDPSANATRSTSPAETHSPGSLESAHRHVSTQSRTAPERSPSDGRRAAAVRARRRERI